MELNIKWTEIREVKLLRGQPYFIAEASKEGSIGGFYIAYWVLGEWKIAQGYTLSIKVTHVCSIHEVTHKFYTSAHAIGDRVIISTSIEEYKKGSIGEIVGKYDKTRTWCIRMEDNFVILLKDKWFNRYYPGGL